MWKLWRKQFAGGIHICGCGHSGTSILTRLIAAHSQIHALPGETGVAKKESYTNYRKNVLRFEAEAALGGSCSWAEKTPKHIRNIRFILNCAPSTKIVLISRNPKDTVGSLKRRYGNIGKSIKRWKSDNRRVLHWREHPQCISILYEDLVTHPGPTMTHVMDFLGFSFESKQLSFHQEPVEWYTNSKPSAEQLNPDNSESQITEITSASVSLDESGYGTKILHNSYRNIQINQPLFNNIGSFRKYLSADEASQVWRACAAIAIDLGYPSDGST